MTSSDNLPLNELEKELLDPNSECYLENLLDVVSALVSDCDFPSAKNSKSVQSFLKKYVNCFHCTHFECFKCYSLTSRALVHF